MKVGIRIGLSVLTLLFAFAAPSADACSYSKPPFWPWEIWKDMLDRQRSIDAVAREDSYAFVFTARVKAVQQDWSEVKVTERIELETTSILKGNVPARVVIAKVSEQTSCGYATSPSAGTLTLVGTNSLYGSYSVEPMMMATGAVARDIRAAYVRRGAKPRAP